MNNSCIPFPAYDLDMHLCDFLDFLLSCIESSLYMYVHMQLTFLYAPKGRKNIEGTLTRKCKILCC
jgi:hypothetical protein